VNRQAWSIARVPIIGALVVFVFTIVIGILNGIDVYTPDHDTLMGHVHSGTLGWITQAFTGVAILAMLGERTLSEGEMKKARTVARWSPSPSSPTWRRSSSAMPSPIASSAPSAPVAQVLILFSRWLFTARRRCSAPWPDSECACQRRRDDWAVFGIVLGLVTAGRASGISEDIADGIAGAHPPAMVVGFLLLATMAIISGCWATAQQPGRSSRCGCSSLPASC
jgi:hypothetical protein